MRTNARRSITMATHIAALRKAGNGATCRIWFRGQGFSGKPRRFAELSLIARAFACGISDKWPRS